MSISLPFPRFTPVADHGVLVEFGDTIRADIHAQVQRLDMALAAEPFAGFMEAVPAYASVLIRFDCGALHHADVADHVQRLLARPVAAQTPPASHEVLVCYDDEFALDMPAVMEQTGLSRDDVVAAHLAGDYSVFMYGFAPGYAYLGGVPERLRLPRKSSPVRGVAAGTVMIAGQQCLVTTLIMPSGWWILGRSPTRILLDGAGERPFLFDVRDKVRFRRIDRATFDALAAQG